MSERPLTAEIVLAEFVPPEARCPELRRAVDGALAAGDVARLAGIICAAQQRQQQQLDFHSQQLAELQKALVELQKLPPGTICNFYSDNRQWHHVDSSQKSASLSYSEDNSQKTVSEGFDLLTYWVAGAIVLVLLASLCPESRVGVESHNLQPPQLHMRRQP